MGFEQTIFAGLFDLVAGALKAAFGAGFIAGKALDGVVIFRGPAFGLKVAGVDGFQGAVVGAQIAIENPFGFGGLADQRQEIGVIGLEFVEPILFEPNPFFFRFAGQD